MKKIPNHRKHALKFIIPMLFVSALSGGAGITCLLSMKIVTALACFILMGATGMAALLANEINLRE